MSVRNALVAALLVAPITLTSLPVRAQDPLGTAAVDPLASSPPAEAEASDVVELRNGGLLRGSILEVLPDDSLTIVSATTGERKTFQWSEIGSYERGGARTDVAPRTAPKPARPEPPPEPETGPGSPRLHIETSRPVNLQVYQVMSEMVASGPGITMVGMAYRPVCTNPCDKVLDGSQGHTFFFGGDGMTASRRFTLSAHSGDLTAQVKPGRKGLFIGGIILASVSPAAMAGGAAWMLTENLTATRTVIDPMTGEFTEVKGNPNYTGGAVLIAIGGAMLVGGIVMAVLGRTRFKLVPRGLGLLRPLKFG